MTTQAAHEPLRGPRPPAGQQIAPGEKAAGLPGEIQADLEPGSIIINKEGPKDWMLMRNTAIMFPF